MAKIDELVLDIHTNIKRDLKTPTNEEIISALKTVMDLPKDMMGLKLEISTDSLPIIITTTIPKRNKDN